MARPPLLKGILYWCALSYGYVATGYLLPSNRLLYKTPSGRVPNRLKVFLFPFFLASSLYNWHVRRRDPTPAFHEIKPGLFLGRRLLPSDRDALRKAGINAVLDVTIEYDALKLAIIGEDVTYLNVPVLDQGVPSLVALHKGVLWIDEQLRAGRRLIVHCALGRGRSATALLAYLIYCDPDREVSELLSEVRRVRPAIAPNYRQLRTLTRYRFSPLVRQAHAALDVIVNPAAGKGRHRASLRLIREALEPHFRVRILETSPGLSGADLAGESIRRGVKFVIAAGGDGTVSAVASRLAGTGVALGVIPLGTANVIASCLYGKLMVSHGIDYACSQILAGRTKKIDVARIEDRLMVLLAGIGFDAKMVQAAEGARKKRWGVAGYLVSGIEALGSAPRLRVTMTIDGETHRFESASVVVANMASMFTIAAQGGGVPKGGDGLLDVTWMLSDSGIASRALSLLELARASLTESPGAGIAHARGREIYLETDQPTAVSVDGEVCLETPVRIRVVPDALTVIVGEQSAGV